MSEDAYRDILVVAEARDGRIRRCTLELLAKARDLADRIGARLECLVLAERAEDLADIVIHHGADTALYAEVEHDGIQAQPLLTGLQKIVGERRYDVVLMSASDMGRDLAPMLAARLATGVANDCIDLDLDESTGLIIAKRPMYGERLVGSHIIPQARPQIATLRPGAGREGFADDGRYGRKEQIEFTVGSGPKLVRIETGGTPPIGLAETVLVGGLGLSDAAWEDLRALAGSMNAAVGATRAAVQAGLAPPEAQVGATGASIKPRLYMSFGVSGAFEHLLGMHAADWIVAVNEDEDANIFGRADYALIGDAAAVVKTLRGQIDGRT